MGFKLLMISGVVCHGLFLALFYEWDTFNPESIRGKRVLITGASSGIGEELAYQYSKLGAAVVITARRKELLQKVASKCKVLGADKVEYVVADMNRPEDRHNIVRVIEKHLKGLDHLILNHAILEFGPWLGTPENMTKLLENMEVNFVSYVDIASMCLKMLSESKGNIGVVSSITGKTCVNSKMSHYSASKHAVEGFFGSFRQELRLRGTGVSVTMCVLGFIATDIVMEFLNATYHIDKISFVAAPVNETATAIVKGVEAKQYEIYFPKRAWFNVWAHKFFPNYVDKFSVDMFFNAEKVVSP